MTFILTDKFRGVGSFFSKGVSILLNGSNCSDIFADIGNVYNFPTKKKEGGGGGFVRLWPFLFP